MKWGRIQGPKILKIELVIIGKALDYRFHQVIKHKLWNRETFSVIY